MRSYYILQSTQWLALAVATFLMCCTIAHMAPLPPQRQKKKTIVGQQSQANAPTPEGMVVHLSRYATSSWVFVPSSLILHF